MTIDFSELVRSANTFTLVGNPIAVAFNTDGSKMFVSDGAADLVREYDLSIAWDISTAVVNTHELDYSSQTSSGTSIIFNSDGSKCYISEGDNAAAVVNEYNLSTEFDLSTAVHLNYGFMDSDADYLTGIYMSGDGLVAAGVAWQDKVYRHTLSSAWDITSLSAAANEKDISTDLSEPVDIWFESDGLAYHILDYTGILAYECSSAYLVSTSTKLGSVIDLTEGGTILPTPQGFFVTNNHVYIIDNTDMKMYQFDFPVPATYTGIVQEEGIGVARLLRIYNRSTGVLVQEVSSDSETGGFIFDAIFTGIEYYIVALDDDDGEDYNDLIYDRIVGV